MRLDVYHHIEIEHHFDQSFVDLVTRQFEALQNQGAQIMATQEELKAQLTGVSERLSEASGEIVAKIAELTAALGTVTPEVQALADELTAKAQGLADIVPNA